MYVTFLRISKSLYYGVNMTLLNMQHFHRKNYLKNLKLVKILTVLSGPTFWTKSKTDYFFILFLIRIFENFMFIWFQCWRLFRIPKVVCFKVTTVNTIKDILSIFWSHLVFWLMKQFKKIAFSHKIDLIFQDLSIRPSVSLVTSW